MAVYLLTIDTLTIIIVRQRWSWFWLYNGHEKLPIVRTNWDFLPPFADAARCLSSLQGCSHHHLDQHHRHFHHHQHKNSFDKITKCSTPSSIKRDHGGHNAKFSACILACYLVLPVWGRLPVIGVALLPSAKKAWDGSSAAKMQKYGRIAFSCNVFEATDFTTTVHFQSTYIPILFF